MEVALCGISSRHAVGGGYCAWHKANSTKGQSFEPGKAGKNNYRPQLLQLLECPAPESSYGFLIGGLPPAVQVRL